MSRKFILEQKPYDDNEILYSKKNVVINPGLTILVGCNGSGKTTLLHTIERDLKNKSIPNISFDNLHNGGNNSRSEAAFENDLSFLATSMSSSEGENIILNVEKFASKLRNFIITGKNKNRTNEFAEIFRQAQDVLNNEQNSISNERWILLDAIDSGLSVDNIIDLKEHLFKLILKDANNLEKDVYIIVSANEYELARNENCLNINTLSYITFKDYDDYRNVIINSRKEKDKRYES